MLSNSSDKYLHHYNIEILNLFDSELQLTNTSYMIKHKLKELFSELVKLKVQAILVLEYQKKNNCKIVHMNNKLFSDIDEAFISMHQSIVTKLRNYSSEDWTVLDVIAKTSIKIFECASKNRDNK